MLRGAAAGVAGLLLLTACTLSDDAEEEPQPRRAVRLELYSSVPEPQRTRPKGEPTVAACRARRTVCPGVSDPGGTYYYALRQAPSLSNEDFDLAETRQDVDSSTGEPIVLLRLSPEGESAFRALTRRLAQRSSPTVLAIVVDGELVSAPTFDPSLYPVGLDPSSGIQLSGLGSLEEARALAQVLKLSADRASAAEMEH